MLSLVPALVVLVLCQPSQGAPNPQDKYHCESQQNEGGCHVCELNCHSSLFTEGECVEPGAYALSHECIAVEDPDSEVNVIKPQTCQQVQPCIDVFNVYYNTSGDCSKTDIAELHACCTTAMVCHLNAKIPLYNVTWGPCSECAHLAKPTVTTKVVEDPNDADESSGCAEIDPEDHTVVYTEFGSLEEHPNHAAPGNSSHDKWLETQHIHMLQTDKCKDYAENISNGDADADA